jgi:hypothetical protein
MRFLISPQPVFDRRTFAMAACLFFAASVPPSLAAADSTTPASYTVTVQGSAPATRTDIDGYSGSVYIYTGGLLPAYTSPAALRFLFGFSNSGKTTSYITPLLFETQAVGQYTVYIVRAIGKGYQVTVNPDPQTIPFSIAGGDKITPDGTYTFGFINALVDPNGFPVATSEGAVEYDIPNVSGDGLGGRGTTNEWAASSSQDTSVPLGTTFGVSGSNAAITCFRAIEPIPRSWSESFSPNRIRILKEEMHRVRVAQGSGSVCSPSMRDRGI